MAPASPHAPAVLLFDGVCNLCNASVNFVLDRDPAGYFRFAALQSSAGQRLLAAHGLPVHELQSLVLIESGRASTRSTAALRVARRLRWPWKLLYVFILVPKFVRDPIYNLIARNRYRWWGKRDACRMPTAELAERFLSEDGDAVPRPTPAH